ncbi:DUF6950 family protein [Brevundimonas sp.]|uniref:DUF6950 family protein n=1 Tax=Brevundimonas sp. TaxID=1871086 RepID=UPI003D0D477D
MDKQITRDGKPPTPVRTALVGVVVGRDGNALASYLEERESWAFGYGGGDLTHDCARCASGGVKAVTGVDPLARFTSQWTSYRGSVRVLRAHGGMAAAVSEVMRAIDALRAQRGDVGMTAEGALVLIEGQSVVGVTSSGLLRLPRAALLQAWSV